MSILIPVHDQGVTLTEIPDNMSVYFSIGECTAHCKGCHSPELWETCQRTSLEDMVAYAKEQVSKGATAIVLMGGTTNGISVNDLIDTINALGRVANVGLYSGSDDTDLHQHILNASVLTWLKTGSFQEDKGGLASPTSNQHLYRVDRLEMRGIVVPILTDITNDIRRNTADD